MTKDSRETIRNAYDIAGAAYDDLRTTQPKGRLLSARDIRLFERLLPDYKPGMEVLEVGAGTGRFTLAALERGYRLIATDINPSLMTALQTKLGEKELNDRCVIRREDAFDLSFPAESFDLVFCVHVIPRFLNFDDQREALTELARVVKVGGHLLFNYRGSRSLYNLIYRGHSTDPSQIKRVLADGGMRTRMQRAKHLLSRRLLDILPLPFGRALCAFDQALETTLPELAWDVFVLAVKDSASGKPLRPSRS